MSEIKKCPICKRELSDELDTEFVGGFGMCDRCDNNWNEAQDMMQEMGIDEDIDEDMEE